MEPVVLSLLFKKITLSKLHTVLGMLSFSPLTSLQKSANKDVDAETIEGNTHTFSIKTHFQP